MSLQSKWAKRESLLEIRLLKTKQSLEMIGEFKTKKPSVLFLEISFVHSAFIESILGMYCI